MRKNNSNNDKGIFFIRLERRIQTLTGIKWSIEPPQILQKSPFPESIKTQSRRNQYYGQRAYSLGVKARSDDSGVLSRYLTILPILQSFQLSPSPASPSSPLPATHRGHLPPPHPHNRRPSWAPAITWRPGDSDPRAEFKGWPNSRSRLPRSLVSVACKLEPGEKRFGGVAALSSTSYAMSRV